MHICKWLKVEKLILLWESWKLPWWDMIDTLKVMRKIMKRDNVLCTKKFPGSSPICPIFSTGSAFIFIYLYIFTMHKSIYLLIIRFPNTMFQIPISKEGRNKRTAGIRRNLSLSPNTRFHNKPNRKVKNGN